MASEVSLEAAGRRWTDSSISLAGRAWQARAPQTRIMWRAVTAEELSQKDLCTLMPLGTFNGVDRSAPLRSSAARRRVIVPYDRLKDMLRREARWPPWGDLAAMGRSAALAEKCGSIRGGMRFLQLRARCSPDRR